MTYVVLVIELLIADRHSLIDFPFLGITYEWHRKCCDHCSTSCKRKKNYYYYKSQPKFLPLTFTDFQQYTWLRPTSCWKICQFSEASLGVLEKFQHSSALPNINYNCAELFLRQMYWSFVTISWNSCTVFSNKLHTVLLLLTHHRNISTWNLDKF